MKRYTILAKVTCALAECTEAGWSQRRYRLRAIWRRLLQRARR